MRSTSRGYALAPVNDFLVLLVAASISAFTVWRLSSTPGITPPRSRAVRTEREASSLRFEDTLEVTAARRGQTGYGMPQFSLHPGEGAEEPPRRKRSLVALTLAITLAAAAGAALLWSLGFYITRLIEKAAS